MHLDDGLGPCTLVARIVAPMGAVGLAAAVGYSPSPEQEAAEGVGVNEGDVVADFELNDQHGRAVRLSDLVDSGPVVLFFYPKAMTPG